VNDRENIQQHETAEDGGCKHTPGEEIHCAPAIFGVISMKSSSHDSQIACGTVIFF
jgi:hypothetical protein